MDEIPITGYADRFSLTPGEKINFKVSCTSRDPYKAKLIRVISGDPNPDGPGIIEDDIKSNLTEFEGSEYVSDYLHKVFGDKEIKVNKNSERSDGQFDIVSEPDWYVYNANYGTSEEKKFVEMFSRRFEHLEKKFENIFLIRNERELKIYNTLGRAFEPDFLLFLKERGGEEHTFQVFIEPKGTHLVANGKWKEEFLQKMRDERKVLQINMDKYLVTGVPFYNYSNENEFVENLESLSSNSK